MSMRADMPDGRGSRSPARVWRGPAASDPQTPLAPLAHLIGRSRFVVLIAVAAVLLVAATLFVLGAWLALHGVWQAVQAAWRGELDATSLGVSFLEVVSVMLKAVVFYLIGVGFYSLFVAPLNLTVALGVETFNDLEIKIVSVVVVILAVTFLEHFIAWQAALDTLLFGLALALVVGALVLFQVVSQRAKVQQHPPRPEKQRQAQHELFHEDHEAESVAREGPV